MMKYGMLQIFISLEQYVAGEEQESIYVFHAARDLANKVINNVAVAKSDYTVRDQVFDLTITADPAVGYNVDPNGCAMYNQQSIHMLVLLLVQLVSALYLLKNHLLLLSSLKSLISQSKVLDTHLNLEINSNLLD